jgi:hypothetical protein
MQVEREELAAGGETPVLKGHGFNRAVKRQ